MTETISLNIAKSNGQIQKFTVQTENKQIINSILNFDENGNISIEESKRLKDIAGRAGDAGILEFADLSGQDKLKLADANKYSDMYEISLSKDGKFFKVKIKDSMKDPKMSDIKADFGVSDGVFIQGSEFPYGNEALFNKRIDESDLYGFDDKNKNYDRIQFKAGDTIKIPVNEIQSLNGPRGFLGRLFKY